MIILDQAQVINSEKGAVKFTLSVSAEFHDGKKYLILGDNGSGKSTLLAALAGLKPYRGRISYDGAEIQNKSDQVFSFGLIDIPQRLKVQEYLNLLGLDLQQSDVFLESVWLQSRKTSFIATLTIEEQNRLKLAVLYSRKYQYILIDEVTHGLPFERVKNLIQFLMSILADATLIMADHHLEDLKDHFDQVLYLEKGKIVKTENYERKAYKSQAALTNTTNRKSQILMIVIKHRIRIGWPLCIIVSCLILLCNLLLFFSATLPYRTNSEGLPFISLKSSDGSKLDLSKSQHVQKGLFNSDFFLVDKDEIYALSDLEKDATTGNNIYQTSTAVSIVSTSYGNSSFALKSGTLPDQADEVAISRDLKSSLEGDMLVLQIRNSIYKLIVTGYIEGGRTISLPVTFFDMWAFRNSSYTFQLTSKDHYLKYHTSNKNIIIAPNERFLKENCDLDELYITDTHLKTKVKLDEEFEVRFDDALEDISVYITEKNLVEYAKVLTSEYKVQLLYGNGKDLFEDRQMYLERGYTVYSDFEPVYIGDAVVLNLLGSLIYGVFIISLYFFYCNTYLKRERVPSSVSIIKTDRTIFSVLYMVLSLPFLVYACLKLRHVPAMALSYLSLALCLTIIFIYRNMNKKVRL